MGPRWLQFWYCTYCYKTSGVRNAHYLVLGVQLTADQYAAVMATVQD